MSQTAGDEEVDLLRYLRVSLTSEVPSPPFAMKDGASLPWRARSVARGLAAADGCKVVRLRLRPEQLDARPHTHAEIERLSARVSSTSATSAGARAFGARAALERGRAAGIPSMTLQLEREVVTDPSAALRSRTAVLPPWQPEDRRAFAGPDLTGAAARATATLGYTGHARRSLPRRSPGLITSLVRATTTYGRADEQRPPQASTARTAEDASHVVGTWSDAHRMTAIIDQLLIGDAGSDSESPHRIANDEYHHDHTGNDAYGGAAVHPDESNRHSTEPYSAAAVVALSSTAPPASARARGLGHQNPWLRRRDLQGHLVGAAALPSPHPSAFAVDGLAAGVLSAHGLYSGRRTYYPAQTALTDEAATAYSDKGGSADPALDSGFVNGDFVEPFETGMGASVTQTGDDGDHEKFTGYGRDAVTVDTDLAQVLSRRLQRADLRASVQTAYAEAVRSAREERAAWAAADAEAARQERERQRLFAEQLRQQMQTQEKRRMADAEAARLAASTSVTTRPSWYPPTLAPYEYRRALMSQAAARSQAAQQAVLADRRLDEWRVAEALAEQRVLDRTARARQARLRSELVQALDLDCYRHWEQRSAESSVIQREREQLDRRTRLEQEAEQAALRVAAARKRAVAAALRAQEAQREAHIAAATQHELHSA